MVLFKMSSGSFLEKVDFYTHKGHFLKEAFSGCGEMRPLATPQHNLEGVKKEHVIVFEKGPAVATGRPTGSKVGFLQGPGAF